MESNMIRETILDNWLQSVLKTSNYRRIDLAGDASFRRYYRIQVEEAQYVVMDAPPPELPELFVKVALILEKESLSVPNIIAQDLQQGFLLLSDLGDRQYLQELNWESADRLYQDAFQALLKIQGCRTELPKFDRLFLDRQMGIFEEWYLKKHLGVGLSADLSLRLAAIYEKIYEVIESQPLVLVHRDYHSRNLMVLDSNNPGILDFQDAMIGPITYDLVSLLQDLYISWPRERVVVWVEDFRLKAIQAGLLSGQETKEEFLRWFDWTGIQRHLKNLGVFARLHHRDNKSNYLKDIPQILKYIFEAAEHYTELKPLGVILESLPELAGS